MILHLLLLISHIKRQVKSFALFYMPHVSYLRVSGFYCVFCVSAGTQNWNSPFQQRYFVAWLFKLLSLNRQNTDTITREHSSSRSEKADLWVGKCHWNSLVPLSLITWHSSTAAHGLGGLCPLCYSFSGRAKAVSLAAFASSVPGVPKGPSSPSSRRAALTQQLRGSCLAAGQSCMLRAGKTLLAGVGLGGLGCFSGNWVHPDILVVLKCPLQVVGRGELCEVQQEFGILGTVVFPGGSQWTV